ncbi:ribonuclease H-like domain-containing protein [Tanacetum coccineum]
MDPYNHSVLVIEFGDSYKEEVAKKKSASGEASASKKNGRTLSITAKDIQLEFMDVIVEQDDINQKFLTSLAPEWVMHTIVWRNKNDLDEMSLDDLYNHLKVYELEVQKKTGSSSQNMAFISSPSTNSGKGDVSTASSQAASSQVTTANSEVTPASFSHDTVDVDDLEELEIKFNMALLTMRAYRFWRRTGKKINIQGPKVAGFEKSKVECFNCHKMGHFARQCRAPRSQDKGRRESYKKDPKVEEPATKALMAFDRSGWDWSYMAEEEENCDDSSGIFTTADAIGKRL